MKVEVAKNIISSFDQITYMEFFYQLLKTTYKDSVEIISNSYLIKHNYRSGLELFNNFYAFDFFPYQVFHSLKNIDLLSNNIIEQLLHIEDNLDSYSLLGYIFLINNLHGFTKDEYDDYVFSKLSKNIPHSLKDQGYGIGNVDTFFINDPIKAISVLHDFFDRKSGLSIHVNSNSFEVNEYVNDNFCSSGVTLKSHSPLNTITVHNCNRRNIIKEFEEIINSNKESQIEEFMSEHYKEIFGDKYNRIETQLWLRFPELDSNNLNRRLDVLLKNSITEDWDIFELKKELNITSHYRGVNTFKSVVYKSIEQLRNYSNLLNQDSVKRKLSNEGIEYYSPELHLVIGKKPDNIPLNNWRNLISKNSKEIKLVTYDSLLREMTNRIENYQSIIE